MFCFRLYLARDEMENLSSQRPSPTPEDEMPSDCESALRALCDQPDLQSGWSGKANTP